MSFITRTGSQFIKDGRRYRFIGVNNYPLIQNHYSSASAITGTATSVTQGVTSFNSGTRSAA